MIFRVQQNALTRRRANKTTLPNYRFVRFFELFDVAFDELVDALTDVAADELRNKNSSSNVSV